MRQSVSRGAVWSLFVLTSLAGFRVAVSQPMPAPLPLPTPAQFVRNLDVRCYKIDKPVRLRLDHLNPLFIEKELPFENVNLDPQQLCVPVRKNDEPPTHPAALPFLKYVDWRCYGIDGPPLNLELRVDHLNPVIATMFGAWEKITVQEPQQLCVPVAKDDLIPPPDIRRLIQWLDVKCYRIDSDRMLGGEPIWLRHLNPLLVPPPPTDPPPPDWPPKELTHIVGPAPFQLCVPVAKYPYFPPDDVRAIVEWADVLCYRLKGQPLNRMIRMTHLNPALSWLPPETFPITDTQKLCVPVAKDQRFPPDWPPPPPPPPIGTGTATDR